jgi:hypothetical protein
MNTVRRVVVVSGCAGSPNPLISFFLRCKLLILREGAALSNYDHAAKALIDAAKKPRAA